MSPKHSEQAAKLLEDVRQLQNVLKQLESIYEDYSRTSYDLPEIRKMLKEAVQKAEELSQLYEAQSALGTGSGSRSSTSST